MFGVFLTAKTTSGKHEGLNRITEAAERFPPLAGALLCSQQHPAYTASAGEAKICH